MQSLLEYDRALLKYINSEWHTSFLDTVLPVLRNQNTWIPLYILLFIFVAIRYRHTRWWWVAYGVATVIATNFISSSLLKHNIIRLRPCNDPINADWIRLFKGIYLPQSSSFTSSHATNHFGMAMFFYLTFKKHFTSYPWLFFVWALAISYAQLYIGLHYPLDVACGAIIGIGVGYFAGHRFNQQYGGLK